MSRIQREILILTLCFSGCSHHVACRCPHTYLRVPGAHDAEVVLYQCEVTVAVRIFSSHETPGAWRERPDYSQRDLPILTSFCQSVARALQPTWDRRTKVGHGMTRKL